MFLRGCFTDVLNALQRVCGIGAAEDTGSKDDSQGISWHSIGLFLEGNSEKKVGIRREVRGEGTSTAPLPHGHGGTEAMTLLKCYLALLASALLCPHLCSAQRRKPNMKTSQVFQRYRVFHPNNLSLQWQEAPWTHRYHLQPKRCGGCSSIWASFGEKLWDHLLGDTMDLKSSSLSFAHLLWAQLSQC